MSGPGASPLRRRLPEATSILCAAPMLGVSPFASPGGEKVPERADEGSWGRDALIRPSDTFSRRREKGLIRLASSGVAKP